MKTHAAPGSDVVAVGSNTTGGEIATNPISPDPVVSRAHDVMDMLAQARLTPASEIDARKKRKWWWLKLSAGPYVSRCAYCGSSAIGPGCSYARGGVHRHQTDEKHCEYFGSTAYGRACSYLSLEIATVAGNRCRWCGSIAVGMGCPYYPTGMHE